MKIGFGDKFIPGETKVQFAGIYWGDPERAKINEVLGRGWFGPGPFCHELEKRLAKYHGLKKASLVNSGSSANLLALAAMKEFYDWKEGREIIVPALSFPTTVNPIIQLGFIPVFVDIELGTYNIDASLLARAGSGNVVAIMFAHALGIPADMDGILDFQGARYEPFIVEDCCDAMGSMHKDKMVGNFGDIATLSFYASHNMTCAGEGGAVLSNNKELIRIVRSLKEWGKMCACEPCPITIDPSRPCALAYQEEIDGLEGMDRRYSYSRLGYNMQMTELQAGFGLAQMDRLDEFAFIRKRNFYALHFFFEASYKDWFILPRFYQDSDPVPFCYPLTVRNEAPFTRLEIVRYLEDHKVETRQLFGGNLVRQPAYKNIRHRIGSSLKNTDKIMRDAFFVGVWPGIDMPRLDYILQVFEDFLSAF